MPFREYLIYCVVGRGSHSGPLKLSSPQHLNNWRGFINLHGHKTAKTCSLGMNIEGIVGLLRCVKMAGSTRGITCGLKSCAIRVSVVK